MNPRTASLPGSKRAADRLLIFLVFLLIPLCGLLLTNKADPDLWMHLRAGRQILETRDVPRVDLYSFSSAGRPWISHEWLFQLLAFLIFSAAGPAGLMLAKAAVGAATLRLLYLAIARRSEALVVRGAVFLVTAGIVVAFGFTCRPQLFTYLGFAAIVFLWEKGDRRRFDVSPWILVPWSWLHGGFVAGAAVYALVCAGEAVQGRRPVKLAAHLGLALSATLLNPYGFGLWTRLVDTLTARQLARFVIEWQPLWATAVSVYRRCFWLLAGLTAAAFAADSDRRKNATSWLLAFGGLVVAPVSARHLLLFALLAAPAIAGGLDRLRGRRAAGADPPAAFFWFFNGALALVIAGLVWWTFYFTPFVRKVPLGALVYGEADGGWVAYPKGAVEFMRAQRIKGRLWADANVGGYLIWHLYPDSRVFLDPRLEHVYTLEQMNDYIQAMNAVPGWEDILKKWSPDVLLLPAGNPLIAAAQGARWRKIYYDADYAVLVPSAAGVPPQARSPAPNPSWPWLFP